MSASANELNRLFTEHQSALHAMIVFHKAERVILSKESEILRAHQLTPPQFAVLETLYSRGSLRVCELISKLLATSGNMTVILRNMERDGLIQKTPDSDDRRSFRISLTDAGRKKVEAVLPPHIANVASIFSGFTEKELSLLSRLLKKFKHNEKETEANE
ncbi:MAG: MarR family transcriptional regulator [Eubacteriales bacterium]|nr:MarR family transcriptional regulator [Eubacteriales bacterium]